MAQEPLRAVVDYLRAVSTAQEMSNWADRKLLEQFIDDRQEAAFAALVRRHGPMVLGVCQRVLGHSPDAEDAFQATFIVLSRRAASVRRQTPLGTWLYSVAQRVSIKARCKAAARKSRQRELTDMPVSEPLDELTWQELRPILDEEIARLPDKCRAAIVLCYFEDKTHEQAALELGWPKSSLTSRLARGRELLRQRLVKRGLTLSAAAITTALSEKSAGAAVGAMLTINTTKAAVALAAGTAVAETLFSAKALTLAEEAMKGMLAMKMKLVALVMACTLAVGGAGWAGYHGLGLGESDLKSAKNEEPAPLENNSIVAEQAKPKAVQLRVDLHGDTLPEGAVARLGQDRWLDGGSSAFASFLPDGKSIVTIVDDGSVRIFEFPSGKEIRRLPRPPLGKTKTQAALTVHSFALSKDGKVLAAHYMDEPDKVFLFDLAGGRELPILEDRVGYTPLFSPDGVHVVTIGNGMVCFWNWSTGQPIRKFAIKNEAVAWREFTPDGKYLINSSKVWDVESEKLIRTLPAAGVAMSRDGKYVSGHEKGQVVIIEVNTGEIFRRLTADEQLNLGNAGHMAFGNDGAKLYVHYSKGVEPTLVEWDIASGKITRSCLAATLPARGRPQYAVSPDGNTLVFHGAGPQCFDITPGKPIALMNRPAAPLKSLQFLPDGKSLLTLCGVKDNRKIERWDTVKGKSLDLLSLPTGLTSAILSPDGKFAAVVALGKDSESRVSLLDVTSGKEIAQVAFAAEASSLVLRLSPDGKTLGVRGIDTGQVSLLELPSLKTRLSLSTGEATMAPGAVFKAPIISPDGNVLAIGATPGKAPQLWHAKTGQPIGSLRLPQREIAAFYAQELAFSHDNRWAAWTMSSFNADAAVGGRRRKNETVLYELATLQPRRIVGDAPEMPKEVFNFASSAQINLPNEFKSGSAVAFSPQGRVFARAGYNGTICLWDLLTGEKLYDFKGHNDIVTLLAFSPDGKTLASASTGGTALIWDVSKYTRAVADAPGTTKALTPADLDACWQTLTDADAAKAWAKMLDLVVAPKDTVPFLKSRLKPAAPLDVTRVEELIQQLDAKQAKVREAAMAELQKIGDQIVPAIDKALAPKPSPQATQSLEKLRDELTGMILQRERLRAFRAIEVLELIGTPEAREVLQSLAEGAPDALMTRSAAAALKRLMKS